MPRRRRFRRSTAGKGRQKHSGSLLVASIGAASAPTELVILETEGGARTLTGTAQSMTASRTTDETCNVGDQIKFLNVQLDFGPRTNDSAEGVGWIEWSVYHSKESDPSIPITQLGTTHLGVVTNRMYPGEVLMSGSLPIARKASNSQAIALKVPPRMSYLKFGDQFRVVVYYRTSNSAQTGTTDCRGMISYWYKGYN